MRGLVAVAGVGETEYYKHGKAPCSQFELTLQAVLSACENAGVDPREIDGFSSYSNDANDPLRLSSALGLPEVTFSCMQWMGGGGGAIGAVANAASAIISGQANVCVVHRGLAQGQVGRFGLFGAGNYTDSSHTVPYGVLSPPHYFAMRVRRYMYEHGVKQEAMRAISLAAYHHAQANPSAVRYGKPLDEETYDNSRWISEPFHLFDCCMENDGAAAIVLVSAERAKHMPNPPCYILSAGASIDYRAAAEVHNSPNYASSDFGPLAKRLYGNAGIGPADVDVLQSYENFTGGVMMSIAECGFCRPEEVNEFLRFENLTLGGRLPLNTSGGHLAHCYMHGLNLMIEGVRQIYGESTSQVEGAEISMVTAGPMAPPVSGCILGGESTL